MTRDNDAGTRNDVYRTSLQELYEDGPCGYLFTRIDGTIYQANATLRDWLGITRDDLPGRRFQDLLTVAGKLFYESQYFPLLRLQGNVKEVSFDLVRPGREPLPVLVSSILRPGPDSTSPLVASAVFDASDRRAYEQELIRTRRSAEQLAAVVRQSTDAIIMMTPSGAIETWNTGAATLFSYQEDRIVGSPLQDIVSPADGHRTWPDLLVDLCTGHAVHLDMVGRDGNGARIDVSVGFTPHRDLLGTVASISVILRDIAERVATQRLQQEFLAMTTHELRSPITGIKGNAQLMQRRGTYSERAVAAIIISARRLEHLVDDLLLASQIEADRLELTVDMVDLAATVQAAVDVLTVADARVQVQAPPVPVLVAADQMCLDQIVINLLTNAIKYSPDGPDISITIANDDDCAWVSVTDRGIGIPSEELPHLFDRFHRVPGSGYRAKGVGLGLYIVHRIVEAHGGRIGVVSEPGKGSTFTVILPRTQALFE